MFGLNYFMDETKNTKKPNLKKDWTNRNRYFTDVKYRVIINISRGGDNNEETKRKTERG
jgi:hypothetical protein